MTVQHTKFRTHVLLNHMGAPKRSRVIRHHADDDTVRVVSEHHDDGATVEVVTIDGADVRETPSSTICIDVVVSDDDDDDEYCSVIDTDCIVDSSTARGSQAPPHVTLAPHPNGSGDVSIDGIVATCSSGYWSGSTMHSTSMHRCDVPQSGPIFCHEDDEDDEDVMESVGEGWSSNDDIVAAPPQPTPFHRVSSNAGSTTVIPPSEIAPPSPSSTSESGSTVSHTSNRHGTTECESKEAWERTRSLSDAPPSPCGSQCGSPATLTDEQRAIIGRKREEAWCLRNHREELKKVSC